MNLKEEVNREPPSKREKSQYSYRVYEVQPPEKGCKSHPFRSPTLYGFNLEMRS